MTTNTANGLFGLGFPVVGNGSVLEGAMPRKIVVVISMIKLVRIYNQWEVPLKGVGFSLPFILCNPLFLLFNPFNKQPYSRLSGRTFIEGHCEIEVAWRMTQAGQLEFEFEYEFQDLIQFSERNCSGWWGFVVFLLIDFGATCQNQSTKHHNCPPMKQLPLNQENHGGRGCTFYECEPSR